MPIPVFHCPPQRGWPLVGLSLLFFLLCLPADGKQEFFPFLGEVTTDRVNVRAGQSVNFETLYQLNKGDQVVVVARAFGWYKIRLPTMAKSYVSEKYVQFLNNKSARITADEVNIRGGAGINHTVLGQLPPGTEVRILEKLEGWYRIEPVEGIYGWVTDEFVKFASQSIPPMPNLKLYASQSTTPVVQEPPAAPSVIVIAAEPLKAGASTDDTTPPKHLPIQKREALGQPKTIEKPAATASLIPKKTSTMPEVVTMAGYLEQQNGLEFKDIQYRLVNNNNQPSYYIQGLQHALDKFLHYKVTVEGTVKTNVQSQDSYPVIIVSKIQLVL